LQGESVFHPSSAKADYGGQVAKGFRLRPLGTTNGTSRRDAARRQKRLSGVGILDCFMDSRPHFHEGDIPARE
jgi:hypothetical protein